MQNIKDLRASYSGFSENWSGVIKNKGKTIWTCSCYHYNRDAYTSRNGRPAIQCSKNALKLLLKFIEQNEIN